MTHTDLDLKKIANSKIGSIFSRGVSGGEVKRVSIAMELVASPSLLLLDEPTRGIDVNAKSDIYELIKSLAAEGMGVIIVSSELPEILALSDRVLVVSEGVITANLPIKNTSEQEILKFAISQNN